MPSKQFGLGELNPQLVREIKGRFKPRNLIISTAIAVLGQLLLLVLAQSWLPSPTRSYSRYCMGVKEGYYSNYPCTSDAAGNVIINWPLWWLDVFVALSIIGIFALLVVGTYMLVSDLAKEESNGTLNFIRLSPQSAFSIALGKILGVSSLLYLVAAFALPLHLWSAIAAGISLKLVLGFYLVVAASGAFFYSAALLFGLVATGLGSFQAWLAAGSVFLFLTITTSANFHSQVFFNPFDWLMLFDPAKVLPYLASSTPHSLDTLNYFNVKDAARLRWYDLGFWETMTGAILASVANSAWWTFWCWHGFKRRFHNPSLTLMSKAYSYWFSSGFTAIVLGFVFVPHHWNDFRQEVYQNLEIVLVLVVLMLVALTTILSPQRQTLQDWARYRHQMQKAERPLWRDFVYGSKSPAAIAIFCNLITVTAILSLGFILLPVGHLRGEIIMAWLLCVCLVLTCASVAQLMMMMRSPKRTLWTASALGLLLVLPPILELWSFSLRPALALSQTGLSAIALTVLVEWTAIVLLNVQMHRQLKKAGESTTKALLNARA